MKLNVGCGGNQLDGWMNVDSKIKKATQKNPRIHFMDATFSWPYFDNTLDAVFSEHMIEHVPGEKGLFMLEQAFRCLKPRCPIRIGAPNRDFFNTNVLHNDHPYVVKYCRDILNNSAPDAQRVIRRTLHDQGHVWVPTPEMLVDQIKRAGFKEVEVVEYGKSKFDVFESTFILGNN